MGGADHLGEPVIVRRAGRSAVAAGRGVWPCVA